MRRNGLNLEKGQSLVVVAILMVAFLGMLALVLDGGYTYFQRRNAQNAADAGAIAAAETLCDTKSWDLAYEKGIIYAEDNNGADNAYPVQLDTNGDGILTEEDRLVRVSTDITFNTFFGRILNQDDIKVVASATAGCYPPVYVEGVMPVAWSCREPITGGWASEDCEYLYNEAPYPYDGQMYLIMDSDKIQEGWEYSHACQDPTWILEVPPGIPDPNLLDCDIDDDGVDDIITGGDRSWLNLTRENAATPELRKWIDQEEKVTLQTHVWAETIDGDKVDVFHTLANHEGEEFILPVYDQLCDTTSKAEPDNPNKLSETICYQNFVSDPIHDVDEIYRDINGQHVHIINYVMFKVVCVGDSPSKYCPTKQAAVDAGLADHNTFTVEGYFTWGSYSGVGGGPNNNTWLDVWKVYLID